MHARTQPQFLNSIRAIFLRRKVESPGQTNRQVVASGRRLNLGRDLRLVTKRTNKFLLASKRKSLKKHFKAGYPLFHWLIIRSWTSINLRWLGLGGQMVKNLLWLPCKFDLDRSQRKSSQVNASARKAWPNGVASVPKFQLASICESVWPGLDNASRNNSKPLFEVNFQSKNSTKTIRLFALDFNEEIVDSVFGLINYHLIEISSS